MPVLMASLLTRTQKHPLSSSNWKLAFNSMAKTRAASAHLWMLISFLNSDRNDRSNATSPELRPSTITRWTM